jgi:hypothetical protein
MPSHRRLAGAALTVLMLGGCTDQPTAPITIASDPSFAMIAGAEPVGYSTYLAELNRRMAAAGGQVAVARAELLVTSDAPLKTPRIIFADDRELRLDTRWVPRDLRRLATDATLSYSVFSPFANATIGGPAEAAIDRSFATWNAVSCSKLAVRKVALQPGQLPSYILTGGLFPPADINDVGFLPGWVFEQVLGSGSSQTTVGVTFTFAFLEVGPNGQLLLDANGNPIPTDVDGDGRFDTAFKEVWYNDALEYATNGSPGLIDIETVALHEHGHALELGHFGKLAGDPKTGKLHVSPRAVMNAALLGVLRTPLGSDNAAVCGNYGSWR